MADSSKRARVAKWRAWRKGHQDFPLSVHPCGQWVKRVRGQLHDFGPLERHELALNLWLHQRDWLLAGEEPPGPDDAWTIGKLVDAWQADVETRRGAGEIVETHARDLLFAGRFIAEHLPRLRLVEKLTPTSFSGLREAVAATGRGLRSQANLISHIRAVFHWGAAMHHHQPVDLGPRFRPPGLEAIQREREARGTTRFINREAILAMLKHAKPAMRCMILLGINCGFYASDSIAIPFSRVHLDHGIPHHDFARMKNGRRRVGVLWPETVAALRAYIAHHRGNNESDCIILNQYGRPYNENAVGRGIRTAWTKLAERAGVVMSPGTSIGSLRHTYGTVVDLSANQKMIDLSMGHASRGMQKRVYSQLFCSDLVWSNGMPGWLPASQIPGLLPSIDLRFPPPPPAPAPSVIYQAVQPREMIYPTNRCCDPMLALLLSLLISGLGQMVIGQVGKGIVILLGSIVLAVVTFGLSIPVIWIVAMIDTYMIANKLRHGQSVGKWEFF